MSIYQKARIVCGLSAFLSFLLSVSLWFSGDREAGIFVGIWVPSILSSAYLVLPSPKGDNA
jgi:hypothetical protein